jgi:3',5'-cyclic AMP phosphodiesterase CpdA
VTGVQTCALPIYITLTWTGDPRTTRTVTWRTEQTGVAGEVQYIEAENAPPAWNRAETAAAAAERLPTNLGEISIHYATMKDLKPGTRYLYRVGDGLHRSEPHSFTTAAAGPRPFKFLIFGDSQGSNYLVWHNTLRNAYQSQPDAAFLMHAGDLVDVGLDCAEWNAWFRAARGVIDTIPVMPLPGNHETYTPEKGLSMPVFFTAQFKLPDNGPAGLKGQVYSFDYGNVHFSILDSQIGEEAQFIPDMLEMEKKWLEQDLAATRQPWKLVFIHRPLYHNRPQEGDEDIRAAFVPVLDAYQADAVFSGHDHVYARSYPLRAGRIAESTDTGTVYFTAGRSGTKTYKGALARDWDEFFYNPLDEPNYLTVEVDGNRITVKTFKQSGVLLDEWSKSKRL